MSPFYKLVVLGTKGIYLKLKKRPLHINLEISLACNARCPFCDYWKSKPKDQTEATLFEFLKKMNPLLITISGGEPLLRTDLPDYVQRIKKAVRHSYINLMTNGSLLTFEKAKALCDSGVSQLCISLDYLSDFHEKVRHLPQAFSKIKELVPQISKLPFDRVTLNTIIMNSNLEHLIPLAYQAKEWGAFINYSSYYQGKNGNSWGKISKNNFEKFEAVVQELKLLKKKLRNISTSGLFFENIVPYFKGLEISDCKAGLAWIQVTPEGYVKRCSEMPPVFHHTEYGQDKNKKFKPTDCKVCWMSCRAEVEAPMTIERMRDLIAGTL